MFRAVVSVILIASLVCLQARAARSEPNFCRALFIGPTVFAMKQLYEALFKVEETIGIPWTIPVQTDKAIRIAAGRGDIDRATNLLLEARLVTSPESTSDLTLNRINNPIINSAFEIPTADTTFSGRIGLSPEVANNIGATCAKIHEGQHLIGSSGCLGRLKSAIGTAIEMFLPAGRLVTSPYRYLSERAAMGAEWELYSRLSPQAKQDLIWKFTPYKNSQNPTLRMLAQSSIYKIRISNEPKIVFIAKVSRRVGYGPIMLPINMIGKFLASPFEWAKAAAYGATIYFYYPEVIDAIDRISSQIP